MTIKRGEGRRLVPLDALGDHEGTDLAPMDTLSADQIYERRWALTVLEEVLARLSDEYRAVGKAALFDRLKKLLTDEPDRPSQAEIADEFGMTENAVKQAFHRLRQRYRELLHDEIAHTVIAPGDVEDELRIWLLSCARNLFENFLHWSVEAMDHWNIRMKIANRFGGKCGARFLSDAPQEFCSACLLESGLFTDEDEKAINSKDPREANSRRMPHKTRRPFKDTRWPTLAIMNYWRK